MIAFRYKSSNNWYKGNIHIHSTASDGGRNLEELSQMYTDKGYDFLCCTDHWAASNIKPDDNCPLLWLDGVELDGCDEHGSYYHVVCLGRFSGITREMGFDAALKSARSQGGFIILSHPYWTGNSLEDALRWEFDGVEIYNHIARWLNGKSDGAVHWNKMLERFPNTLAFAVDDAHLRPEHPGWDGGWIMVNAAEKSRKAIYEAIRKGNFYSTCGPDFLSIEYHDNTVIAKTSPVQFTRLVGPGSHGQRMGSFDDARITEVAFEIPPEWSYAYLEIEDEHGRRAWTNPLFVVD